MPTSADPPVTGGLQLLARAVSGRPLRVRAAAGDTPHSAYVVGDVIVIPRGETTARIRTQVITQAAMSAAGSFEPAILGRLVGRSRTCARYCAIEGLRSLLLASDRLPQSITDMAAQLHGIPVAGSAEESLRLALSRVGVDPLPDFFGELRPARGLLANAGRSGADHQGDLSAREDPDKTSDDDDDPDNTDRAKALDNLSNPLTANHPMARLIQSLFKHSGGSSADAVAQAGGGGRPVARASRRPSGGQRVSIGRRLVLAAASVVAKEYEGDFTYPEWDEASQRYRRDWVTVHELEPWNPDNHRSHEALAHLELNKVPSALSASLARTVLGFGTHGRSTFGEQLHTDGVVDLAYWRRTGRGNAPRPFADQRRRRPVMAAMVLLDVSGSTVDDTTEDSEAGSVFDQHLRLSYRITSALDALGVPVGYYAFRSFGREMVHVMPIKEMRERLSSRTLDRMGHLQPAGFTRIGSAVRHCAAVLENQAQDLKRVLILVSDGFPYDDDYQGGHAAADTRRAMSEARLRGTAVVCVGVTAPDARTEIVYRNSLDSASALHIASVAGIEQRLGPLVRQALADTRRRSDHSSA